MTIKKFKEIMVTEVRTCWYYNRTDEYTLGCIHGMAAIGRALGMQSDRGAWDEVFKKVCKAYKEDVANACEKNERRA